MRVELNVERNSGTYTYRDLSITNTTVRTRGHCRGGGTEAELLMNTL